MSTAVNKIEQILTSAYSVGNYVAFVQEIFDSMKLVAPNNLRKEFSNFSTHIVGSAHIGNYTTPDNKKIAIFSVELKNESYVESSRSTQRSYAKKLIENGNCDAALVAFYTEGETKWRLSFVRLDYEMKIEHGKLKTTENITPAKRYSFLVGRDEPCHTAIERFRQFIVDQNYNPSLDEIEEAFSVEKVTKEFFSLYCEKFYQLQEFLDQDRDFIAESKRCGFTSEQYAKKLLGQIVFLYFLQKKGWLGVSVWPSVISDAEYKKVFYVSGAQGRIIREHLPNLYTLQSDGTYRLNSKYFELISNDEEETIARYMVKKKSWGDGSKKFLRTIFEYSKTHKGHFFENYLEPLFYDTLNRNRGALAYCPALHCRIPFLSGGLFEPLIGYDWRSNYFDIPDEIFSNKKDENDREADGILDIFDRYNFTMSEDEPMEREVAVDPEMLGKIFENLLDIKDRKNKGAFYTPREIVHYMCQESLINYLVRKTGVSEEAVRDFILYGDFMKDEDTIKAKREGNGGMFISSEIFKVDQNGTIVVNRLSDIDDALATVRVADPAVGSGAFPLGMVNEIVRARQNITAYMTIGMKAHNKYYLYRNERSPYRLKLNAIKNSIFAVDIEPSAVDIAQLRLWLSLVIDDEITPNAENELEGHRDPLPLPNLDCNILCGNSLIDEFKGVNLVKGCSVNSFEEQAYQMEFRYDEYEAILKQLLTYQDELFYCDEPHKKYELKSKIQSLKDLIISEQLSDSSDDIKAEYSFAIRCASKPFVLWQIDFARVFRDNGGFDIVIGNPPYVSTKGVSKEDKEVYSRVFGFSDDTYNLFTFKGMSLIKNGGSINYIIPKTFWTTQTKKNMRDLLLKHRIAYIFDTANPFESAMVDTCIIQAIRTPYDESHVIRFLDGSSDLMRPDITTVLQKVYINTQNSVIFKPTKFNMNIYELYGEKVKKLYEFWWDRIKTSKDIEKNAALLKEYRENLKPGDVALLGCLTEGGQGLATANNGKFIAVRKSTKWAKNILQSRPLKLVSAMKDKKIPIEILLPYSTVDEFFENASEKEIVDLFDSLKEKYGRDIFGQGYIFRLIDDSELADVDSLTQDEKENGIDESKKFYVPYDKGDKDGNRWYLETPFAIAWSKDNVRFLKTNSGKKGSGMPVVRNPQFNFREGFCWSDINTTYLKCRIKGKSVNDVKSMSLYGFANSVPEFYFVSLINSSLFSFYVDSFVNNTQTFQINDARQLPILIPSEEQLTDVYNVYMSAIDIKKRQFSGAITEENALNLLTKVQKELDTLILCIYGIKR